MAAEDEPNSADLSELVPAAHHATDSTRIPLQRAGLTAAGGIHSLVSTFSSSAERRSSCMRGKSIGAIEAGQVTPKAALGGVAPFVTGNRRCPSFWRRHATADRHA